ncbi:hypothetical protein LEMLEM_LOCUS7811 [Lemmus lemmus]
MCPPATSAFLCPLKETQRTTWYHLPSSTFCLLQYQPTCPCTDTFPSNRGGVSPGKQIHGQQSIPVILQGFTSSGSVP